MSIPPSKQKIPINCIVCGKLSLVRKDVLKSKVGISEYKCRNCCNRGKKRTREQKLKMSLIRRKYSLNESFFAKIDSEKKAYWLGFLSGDGTITENKVRLCLAIKDKNHLMKFKKIVNWNGKDYYHKDTGALEVYFRSSRMVTDLAKYYIVPRKTFSVRFPDILESLERHFIRGVFDADGCISRANRTTQSTSGKKFVFYGGEFSIGLNKEFVSDIQSRFASLDLPLTSTHYSNKKIGRVRYGGINQLKKIYEYLYKDATIFLERKKELFQDIIQNYHREILLS